MEYERAKIEAREEILGLVGQYYQNYLKENQSFRVGDSIRYGGRVYDQEEVCNLVDACLDFWLTSGRYVQQFEEEFSKYLGVRYTSLVNSGSSANLLAFYALTALELGERRIVPGDEVITVAACFPTTISPIIQYGAVPVFVDVGIPQYNILVEELEEALTAKTKAVMVAHTLGNPINLQDVRDFCDRHKLWLVEDNCDALGSEYYMEGEWKYTGTIGDLGTSSFYPPHHMTMGEGGCVYTNNPLLHKLVNSFRDWGRDCCCPSGVDNFCKRRFEGQYGLLPKGYDHKYVYARFGFNLKATEMQAAIGCAQLKKLSDFVEKRRQNWDYLYRGIKNLEPWFELPKPCEHSKPSWFGFLLTLKQGDFHARNKLIKYLEDKGIQTRLLFSGNILLHPCFNELRTKETGYRVVGTLSNTQRIAESTFWVGVYPGMTKERLDYMIQTLAEAVSLLEKE